MFSSIARFQKFDQFNNAVFIASKSREAEAEAFNKLTKYHLKLEKEKYGTFLPIYSDASKAYATIRFKKNPRYNRMKPDAIYEVKFDVKKISKDDKIYVNCFLRKLKLVSEAPEIDEGSDLCFSDSE